VVTMDTQIDDLRERMKLLQGDRKANYENLESSKTGNQDLIRKLQDENKELRRAIGQLQQASHGKKTPAAPAISAVTYTEEDLDEINAVQGSVNRLRKQTDDSKTRSTSLAKELQSYKDQVKDLDLESKRPNMEDSPFTRKIRMLENRLDKAMIKYNEAQSIRKTYEQIVKRLKEERVGFDNQLGAIERTLSAKQHDFEELQLLSGDASHARDVAYAEKERVGGGYDEERRNRERLLREKQQSLQIKTDISKRMADREKKRHDIVGREAGDLDEFEERNLKKALTVNKLSSVGVQQDKNVNKQTVDVYEEAFRKIKDATGVSDINEVIQKIINQESTTDSLVSLTRENQQKIEQLNDEKTKLKAHVEEIKYSGLGGSHQRKMVDDHEERLAGANSKLEWIRMKFERLTKLLIAGKAGIEHLSEKLDNVREDKQHIQVSDDTIENVLYANEQTVVDLVQMIAVHEEKEGSLEAAPSSATLLQDDSISRPFNQRVNLPSVTGDDNGGDDIGLDGDELEDPEHEGGDADLSRERVKKASVQIVQLQDKKKAKRGKKVTMEGGKGPGVKGSTRSGHQAEMA
jgi:chromosome segregation ATPase